MKTENKIRKLGQWLGAGFIYHLMISRHTLVYLTNIFLLQWNHLDGIYLLHFAFRIFSISVKK